MVLLFSADKHQIDHDVYLVCPWTHQIRPWTHHQSSAGCTGGTLMRRTASSSTVDLLPVAESPEPRSPVLQLTLQQQLAIASRVDAEMSMMKARARGCTLFASARNHEDTLIHELRRVESMPDLKDKAKDKHRLRESSGAQLWSVRAKKVTRDITVAKAIGRPHSGLHRKAQKVWNEHQLPKPIEHSTKRFDDKLKARQQEAREAFRTVSKEPNLTTEQEFGSKIRELSRVRFTIVAPVAHRAEAYPDAVWGIQLDRMGGSNYDRQGNKVSGMSFSGPPNNPGSPRPIPMLPAMPGMDNSDEHMLLPDSHFALGSFSSRKQSSSSEGKLTPIDSSKRLTPMSKFSGPGGLKKLGKLSMLSGMLGKAAKEYSTKGERQGCPRPGGSGGDWELYRWQLSQLRADNSYRPSKEGVGIGPDGVPYVNSGMSPTLSRPSPGLPGSTNSTGAGRWGTSATNRDGVLGSSLERQPTDGTFSGLGSLAATGRSAFEVASVNSDVDVHWIAVSPDAGPTTRSNDGGDGMNPATGQKSQQRGGVGGGGRGGIGSNGQAVSQGVSDDGDRSGTGASGGPVGSGRSGGADARGQHLNSSSQGGSGSGAEFAASANGHMSGSGSGRCNVLGSVNTEAGAGAAPKDRQVENDADVHELGSGNCNGDGGRGGRGGGRGVGRGVSGGAGDGARGGAGWGTSGDASGGAGRDANRFADGGAGRGASAAGGGMAGGAAGGGLVRGAAGGGLAGGAAGGEMAGGLAGGAAGAAGGAGRKAGGGAGGGVGGGAGGGARRDAGAGTRTGKEVSRGAGDAAGGGTIAGEGSGGGGGGGGGGGAAEGKSGGAGRGAGGGAGGGASTGTCANADVSGSGRGDGKSDGSGTAARVGDFKMGDLSVEVPSSSSPKGWRNSNAVEWFDEVGMEARTTHIAAAEARKRLCRGRPLIGPALEMSCWRGRKHGKYACDSSDYIDTERCLKKAFLADWSHTTGGQVLEADMKGRAFGVREGQVSKEIIEDIMDGLFEHYPMILRVFTYYSCIGSETSGVVYGIGRAGYTRMINDARLDALDINDAGRRSPSGDRKVARHAKLRGEDGFDLLWATVNTTSTTKNKNQSSTNSKERLARSEFLEWLVRAATDELPPKDFGQNVRWLCEDMGYFLGLHENAALIFTNTNWFRLDACYLDEVNMVLTRHQQTLRSIFDVYAAATGVGGDVAERADLMNYEEWSLLWSTLGFTRELSDRKVGTIFSNSRMMVINEYSKSGKSVQLERLPFEGFLEAMVRVADVKILPLEDEVRESGYKYPGEYLHSLRPDGQLELYKAWAVKTKRARDQEDVSDPIWSRLEYLILIIVFVMQQGTQASHCATGVKADTGLRTRASDDIALSTTEVNKYLKNPKPNLLGTLR